MFVKRNISRLVENEIRFNHPPITADTPGVKYCYLIVDNKKIYYWKKCIAIPASFENKIMILVFCEEKKRKKRRKPSSFMEQIVRDIIIWRLVIEVTIQT